MEYMGVMNGGVVLLEDAPEIADGTPVKVMVADAAGVPTLAELFEGIAGQAVGLPADLAENHDHYIHGAPKRGDL